MESQLKTFGVNMWSVKEAATASEGGNHKFVISFIYANSMILSNFYSLFPLELLPLRKCLHGCLTVTLLSHSFR